MKKVFEDYFSEIQADMVAICLEYVEKEQREFIFIVLAKKVCCQVASFLKLMVKL